MPWTPEGQRGVEERFIALLNKRYPGSRWHIIREDENPPVGTPRISLSDVWTGTPRWKVWDGEQWVEVRKWKLGVSRRGKNVHALKESRKNKESFYSSLCDTGPNALHDSVDKIWIGDLDEITCPQCRKRAEKTRMGDDT